MLADTCVDDGAIGGDTNATYAYRLGAQVLSVEIKRRSGGDAEGAGGGQAVALDDFGYNDYR